MRHNAHCWDLSANQLDSYETEQLEALVRHLAGSQYLERGNWPATTKTKIFPGFSGFWSLFLGPCPWPMTPSDAAGALLLYEIIG